MTETLYTLVVDDELGMRLSIKKALSRFELNLPDIESTIHFEVDVAESGEEAIAKIRNRRPDLLLLDYKLPEMSGLDVLEKVKADESEMLTIMITAYASIDIAISAVKQGAYDFIGKPFTPDELRKTVSKTAQQLILARQVRKLAQERKQVRFQFISVLGHELKSPLNAVEGYLNILKDCKPEEKVVDYMQMIDRSLFRIQGARKLIVDLLDLTRIESGQKKRQIIENNISEIIERSVESVLPLARGKEIQINNHISSAIPYACDAGELEIILNNLLSNAVKYNKDKGQIDIHAEIGSEYLEISVKDTGIGMTEEEQSRLFGEFVRIQNDKTRNISGSGLGLSIMQKIIQLYKGKIDIQSQPDQGTTFKIYLKLSPSLL